MGTGGRPARAAPRPHRRLRALRMKERTFGFSFTVNEQFRRLSPVAEQFIEGCKAQIAARVTASGPRGGLYRLTTPPDRWRETNDYDGYDFIQGNVRFLTKRSGVYVPPRRVTPDLLAS